MKFGAVTRDNVSYRLCVPSCGYWTKIGLRSDLHSSRWHFQTRWTVEMLMGAFQAAVDVYISYKFGGLLSSSSAVNAAQLCTAGMSQHSG